MACRTCGIGPVKKMPPTTVKNIPDTNKVKIKGAITPSKKVSLPTRSPARTFNTPGD